MNDRLIAGIVPNGSGEALAAAARAAGAPGATVLPARGTAASGILQLLGLGETAKEVVLLAVPGGRTPEVLAAVRDFGARRLLNLGHSFGHAIEAFSGYTVPHGQAVAEGLLMITRAAAERGLCEPAVLPRLTALMERYGLEADRSYAAAELLPFLRQDKKLRGGTLPLIVPRSVGHCDIIPVPLAELASWLKSGGAL